MCKPISYTKKSRDGTSSAGVPWSRRASHWWQPWQASHVHFTAQLTSACLSAAHQPWHFRRQTQSEFSESRSHRVRGAPRHLESFPTHSPVVSGTTGSQRQWAPLPSSSMHCSSPLPSQRESVPTQCMAVVVLELVVLVLEIVVLEVVLVAMVHGGQSKQDCHPHFCPQLLVCRSHHGLHMRSHAQSESNESALHRERDAPLHRESFPTHSPIVSGTTESHRQSAPLSSSFRHCSLSLPSQRESVPVHCMAFVVTVVLGVAVTRVDAMSRGMNTIRSRCLTPKL